MAPLFKLLMFILIKIKLNNKSGVSFILAISENRDFCLLKAVSGKFVLIVELLTDVMMGGVLVPAALQLGSIVIKVAVHNIRVSH